MSRAYVSGEEGGQKRAGSRDHTKLFGLHPVATGDHKGFKVEA